jgi:hypothetical protein
VICYYRRCLEILGACSRGPGARSRGTARISEVAGRWLSGGCRIGSSGTYCASCRVCGGGEEGNGGRRCSTQFASPGRRSAWGEPPSIRRHPGLRFNADHGEEPGGPAEDARAHVCRRQRGVPGAAAPGCAHGPGSAQRREQAVAASSGSFSFCDVAGGLAPPPRKPLSAACQQRRCAAGRWALPPSLPASESPGGRRRGGTPRLPTRFPSVSSSEKSESSNQCMAFERPGWSAG